MSERDDNIRSLYAAGLTMQECGDLFGLTRARIQQIVKGRIPKRQLGTHETPQQRFWAKVAVTDNSEDCWEWTHALNTRGYGHFFLNGKHCSAHRLSYLWATGHEPTGWVLHTCDNPKCVNPCHLYDGTPQDNANDRVRRGRSRGHRTRLSNYEVTTIRSLLELFTQAQIAAMYGINVATVNSISTGRTHKRQKNFS